MPRIQALALVVALAVPATLLADVPAELLTTPPPAAQPAPASGGDAELLAEIIGIWARGEAEKLENADPAKRAEFFAETWKAFKPHEKAVVRYASEHFREGGKLLTPRTVTLLALGAPERVHDEPAHVWPGEPTHAVANPLDLVKILKPGTKGAPAPAGPALQGPLPTQVWVYPGNSVSDKRLVWFVDEGADGTWTLAKDQASVPLASLALTSAAQDMPAELFPAVGAGVTFEALPTPTKGGLGMSLADHSFRASAGKTLVRLMATIDPSDVELDIDADPAAYKAEAMLWVRVEMDGVTEHQEKTALSALGAGEPWLAAFDVALPPGKHQVTLVAVDKAGTGGTKLTTVDVPSYAGGLALSSMVLAKAEMVGGEMGLPKAPVGKDGALAPFQIGTLTVRPQVPPVFKRGDTVAVVVQVYGTQKATLELDLFRDGSYQSSTDPVEIREFPHPGIELITILPEFADGAYEFKYTAKSGGTEASRTVSFRVRG